MKIYVGRWDLLPKAWKGINGLYEKSEKEIYDEIQRQDSVFGWHDDYIGVYDPFVFEETFNQGLENQLTGETYFIRIF